MFYNKRYEIKVILKKSFKAWEWNFELNPNNDSQHGLSITKNMY